MTSLAHTFEVDHVRPAKDPVPVLPNGRIWQAHLQGQKIEAVSRTDRIAVTPPMHALLGAVTAAWNHHLPLELSPDVIWLTIAQGVALHVNQNAEKLRPLFVAHQGKKILEVERGAFIKGADNNDWPGVFGEFSAQIGGHIGKKRDLLINNFSTTTPLSRVASDLVLMDAMKQYFSYRLMTMCGFPSITLTGTVEDWESVYLRASYLAELDLGWWTVHLLPVLEQLVATAKGQPDVKFWRRLYSEDSMSGGTTISGWICALYPYVGKDPHVRKSAAIDWASRRFGSIHHDDVPLGLAKVPFEWHYYNEVFNMEFVGGLVGVEVRDDNTITPAFGWAIVEKAQGAAP